MMNLLAGIVLMAVLTTAVCWAQDLPFRAVDSRQAANKEFWDRLYHNAFANTKTKYDVLNGDRVCLTCPIDRAMYNNLYHEVAGAYNTPASQVPPRVSITWTSQLPNDHTIFYCRNNTRVTQMPALQNYDTDGYSDQQRARGSGEVDFTCENNQLCLNNVRYHYPDSYQCLIRSYVQSVKLNVIVELQSLLLYFGGDSVKFDFQKEVQVFENQIFTVKCEVPETNPVSTVSAYIDNKKLKLSDLKKKPIENRMTINTYSYEVNATRNMNGKRIKCEAQMENLPSEFASLIELRSYISKEYTLSVFYLPTCVYNDRIYKTGINRSITIECPINGSNPDVTYYKIIPPSPRTKFEQIDTDLDTLRRIGRYRINPTSQADFGVYQCIPRSLSGTAQCDIHVELGATPNPPEHCQVQFNSVNNKTFAQFSCRPGFNQGGSTSFLTIYEQTLPDKQLKLSGRVNIDESKGDKEVPYITPADEDKYYEFVIIQENNYGNSTSVLLTLGTPEELKVANFWDSKSTFIIAGAVALAIFVMCACVCCCCSDLLNKPPGSCCPSKCGGQADEEDGPTYKKGVETFNGSQFSSHFNYNDLSKDSMKNANDHLLDTPGYYDNPNTDLHGTLYKGRNLKGSIYKDDPMNDEEAKYEDSAVDDEDEDEYARKNRSRLVKKTNDYLNRKPYYDNEEEDEVDEDEEEGSNKANNQEEDLDSLTEKSGSEDNQVYVHTTTSIKQQVANGMDMGRQSAANTLRKNMGGYGVTKNGYRNVANGYVAVGGAGNHYSSIDPKSLKLIQTKNGLVYTPKTAGLMNASRNKSNDALLYNDDDGDEDVQKRQQRHKMNDYEGIYDNKTLLSTNNNKSLSGTLRRSAREQTESAAAFVKPFVDPNENFKMELAQKLKSMSESGSNGQPDPPVRNGTLGRSTNMVKTGGVPVYKPITLAQPEHFSNTTATTSISSASSCASSNDLVIKEVGYLSASTKSANSTAPTAITTTEVNKNYSLLKTTLNAKTENERPKPTGAGETGTLGRGTKPAITKPKPRVDAQAPSNGRRPPINAALLNTTAVSVHNQSTDTLIKNGKEHASQHTSPSTSVTDVSSTNCTPQHGGNSADENGQFIPSSSSTSSANSSTKQISRSRSNSLTRPNPLKHHHQHHHPQPQPQAQQFKTFVQDSSAQQSIYSSNGIYSSHTLSRNKPMPLPSQNTTSKPTMTTIDDEISMIASNRNNRNNRTLERRHVKNSEC